jgi:hypothetical protein
MKQIRDWTVPILSLVGMWISCYYWYYGTLAMNNWFRLMGMDKVRLPSFQMWIINVSKYRISLGVALIFTVLVLYQMIRKKNVVAALHLSVLGLLVFALFSSVAFASFSFCLGTCLCDGWRHW